MEYEQPEIIMDEALRLAAKKPIDKMLEISAREGIS
jgi:quinolinate synthase